MKTLRQATAFAIVALLASADARSEEKRLVDFELEDQFGNVHRRVDVEGTVVLLIGSDKGGVSFNGLWSNSITEPLENHPRYHRLTQLAYSDLRGVPFFLKGMVRRKFPENPGNWALMDWKGDLAKTYDFERNSSNILVFAPDGLLVQQHSGRQPDQETVAAIVEVLRKLLENGS